MTGFLHFFFVTGVLMVINFYICELQVLQPFVHPLFFFTIDGSSTSHHASRNEREDSFRSYTSDTIHLTLGKCGAILSVDGKVVVCAQ